MGHFSWDVLQFQSSQILPTVLEDFPFSKTHIMYLVDIIYLNFQGKWQ